MARLAINGGEKLRAAPFPAYAVIGKEEEDAAVRVLRSGVLSKFLGCWDADFFGGNEVQSLERDWAAHFGAKYAIAVNSNSSGLICALGALNVGPGDQVIVSPYSMSISASAPLFYGAVPVFADIEDETFCLDPVQVRRKITSKTKAIISVSIFGHPHHSAEMKRISDEFRIPVIEDCAQAPGARDGDKLAGNLGDLGVFSLNYHKHIHSGEGGIIVTNDENLATRCRLIRNHAEAVVDGMAYTGSPVNMVGYNFRMTELEAAIAREQLKKLDALLDERIRNVEYLESRLRDFTFLHLPRKRQGCKHVYYVHGIKYEHTVLDVHRDRFVEAVRAELPDTELRLGEGALISGGYVRPLYLQSLYQRKIAFGGDGYPFNLHDDLNYSKGLCPVAERMHESEFFGHELMTPGMKTEDLDVVVAAFSKVADNVNELR